MELWGIKSCEISRDFGVDVIFMSSDVQKISQGFKVSRTSYREDKVKILIKMKIIKQNKKILQTEIRNKSLKSLKSLMRCSILIHLLFSRLIFALHLTFTWSV